METGAKGGCAAVSINVKAASSTTRDVKKFYHTLRDSIPKNLSNWRNNRKIYPTEPFDPVIGVEERRKRKSVMCVVSLKLFKIFEKWLSTPKTIEQKRNVKILEIINYDSMIVSINSLTIILQRLLRFL